MHKHFIRLVWLAPLLLHSMDANAWGLLTHVYFAQWLVWTLPLLDPNLRRAVQRFPDLVLAGACRIWRWCRQHSAIPINGKAARTCCAARTPMKKSRSLSAMPATCSWMWWRITISYRRMRRCGWRIRC